MRLNWVNAILPLLFGLAIAQSTGTNGETNSTSDAQGVVPSQGVNTTAGGTFGIAQDQIEGFYHWSSIAKFSAQDAQKLFADDRKELTALAKAAYQEMLSDIADNQDEPIPEDYQPFTMTAMAIGQEVHFSSTIKGGPFMYTAGRSKNIDQNVAEEVFLALQRCQHESPGGTIHRTGAACGEPLAAQQYCVDNPDKAIKGQNGLAVTWGKYNKDDPDTAVQVLNPCTGGAETWGCEEFLPEIGVTGVRDSGIDPGNPTITPESTRPACLG